MLCSHRPISELTVAEALKSPYSKSKVSKSYSAAVKSRLSVRSYSVKHLRLNGIMTFIIFAQI